VKEGRYKLAKAAGGCCHFADVSIRVGEPSNETKIIDESGTYADMVEGAVFGLKLELDRIDQKREIIIDEIVTTMADSTPPKVSYAAIFALRSALRIEEYPYPRFEGREIVFEEN